MPDGRVEGVEGRVEGSLVREPRGTNGFGYDPAFVPTGDTRTLAEYTDEEKNAISHRGNAFRALEPVLRSSWPDVGPRKALGTSRDPGLGCSGAQVAELVDAPDLGSGAFGCAGSSPALRTRV